MINLCVFISSKRSSLAKKDIVDIVNLPMFSEPSQSSIGADNFCQVMATAFGMALGSKTVNLKYAVKFAVIVW